MERDQERNMITRRQLLRGAGLLAGSAMVAHFFPGALSGSAAARYAQQGAGAAPADALRLKSLVFGAD